MMLSITIIGSSGSGKSTLQAGLKNYSPKFVMFPKMTTRKQRIYEIDGCDYYFVNDNTFDESIAKNKLIHVKYSDFDHSKYGVDKSNIICFINKGLIPVFTSHSLEEAQQLTHCLNKIKVSNFCIYIYTTEQNRRKYLFDKNENEKYYHRYYVDIAFKMQAFLKKFQDCHYFIYNNGCKNDLLMHCEVIDQLLHKKKFGKFAIEKTICHAMEIEINSLIQKIDNE